MKEKQYKSTKTQKLPNRNGNCVLVKESRRIRKLKNEEKQTLRQRKNRNLKRESRKFQNYSKKKLSLIVMFLHHLNLFEMIFA